MKIQAPLECLPVTDGSAARPEGLTPSGQLALQKLSEVTTQRKEKDKAMAPSVPPLSTRGTHIDIRV